MTAAGRDSAATGDAGAGFPPPPDGPSFRLLIAALRAVDWLSYWIIVPVMAAMSLILAAQVVARYGLGTSIDSANELSRLFFVWAMFLAIPHGIKYGVHVGIDVFVLMLPRHWQTVLFRVTAFAGLVLMAILLYFATIAAADKWQELMPTLPVTAAVYYIAVVIACGHSLLHLTALLWGGPLTWHGEKP